jgi:UDP-hydrolysing UDP-N-acetyl-D-glucosamine 2-epimerase
MKRKICVVVTARPSYSRIKSALTAIKGHADLELQLVVAASALLDRYGKTVEIIEGDDFDITERVYMILEGENLVTSAKSTGLGIVELATVFDNLKPDMVVTIADRYETMATAIAASYMNIVVAHIQGGEVTGSIDDKVRHAVTKLSNLHFVSHELASERVIRMGEDPEAVFVTGCPSIDLASSVLQDPSLSFDPFERYGGVGASFDYSDGYLVVLQHPVTTEYEHSREHVTETLRAVKTLDIPTFWFWPNVDAGSDGTSKGIRTFREQEEVPNIHFFKNMKPEDFLKLLYNSQCIVGNSSVGIRECAFLGVSAVNIGSRQIGRVRGRNTVDSDEDATQIAEAIENQVRHGHYEPDPVYGSGNAGHKIAELLATQPLVIKKRLTY